MPESEGDAERERISPAESSGPRRTQLADDAAEREAPVRAEAEALEKAQKREVVPIDLGAHALDSEGREIGHELGDERLSNAHIASKNNPEFGRGRILHRRLHVPAEALFIAPVVDHLDLLSWNTAFDEGPPKSRRNHYKTIHMAVNASAPSCQSTNCNFVLEHAASGYCVRPEILYVIDDRDLVYSSPEKGG